MILTFASAAGEPAPYECEKALKIRGCGGDRAIFSTDPGLTFNSAQLQDVTAATALLIYIAQIGLWLSFTTPIVVPAGQTLYCRVQGAAGGLVLIQAD